MREVNICDGKYLFFLHGQHLCFVLHDGLTLSSHALLSLPLSRSQEGNCNIFRLLQHLPRKSLCLQQGPDYRRSLHTKSPGFIPYLAFLSVHFHDSNIMSVRMLTQGFLTVLQQNALFIAAHYQQGYCELDKDMGISVSKTWLNYAPGTCKDLTGVFKDTLTWLSLLWLMSIHITVTDISYAFRILILLFPSTGRCL